MTKVSVVIPIFNHADMLERTVNSVLSQSTPPFETIIVDDGSTKENAQKIQSIADKHSIRLIKHEFNQGVSQARNTGIMACSGDWVALIDSDDYWDPMFIESTLQVALDNSAGLVGTNYHLIHADNTISKSVINNVKQQQHKKEIIIIDDYFKYSITGDLPFTSSSVLLNRKSVIKCGLFNTDLIMGEDQLLWYNLVKSGTRSIVLDEALSNYDLSGANSACNSISKVSSWEFLKNIHEKSIDDTSPYKQPYINKNSFKAFLYAVSYNHFDIAMEIRDSHIVRSSLLRKIMWSILLLPDWLTSLSISTIYKRFSKR